MKGGNFQLRLYYDVYFRRIWNTVLYKFATLCGMSDLARVELVPRWNAREGGGGTVMNRSLVFESSDALIAYCQEQLPETLQLGGILPQFCSDEETRNNPREARRMERKLNSNNICAAYGPLVIDVDMDDYNRMGVCLCQAGQVCKKCWAVFMEPGRASADHMLRHVFHFEHILHVWSGRRGFHVWVFDERVLHWDRETRKSFIHRLASPQLGDCGFEHVVQQILFPVFRDHINSDIRWERPDQRAVIIDRLYPKFDKNVTADVAHLKGLPLSTHHRTRCVRVCLPPIERAQHFDIEWAFEKCLPRSMPEEAFAIQLEYLGAFLDQLPYAQREEKEDPRPSKRTRHSEEEDLQE